MKRLLAVIFITIISLKSFADEGMWLPQLLATLNEKEMKKMGMKINANDIYNINKSSLKDAIVSLGGFCTAEVISNQGLILTNHHCGFDAIQNHTTLENNYIKNGYWAYEKNQELRNPNLFVSFIIRIEEVTTDILKGTTTILSEKERQAIIDKNINSIKSIYKKENWQDIIIRPFFEGNKYFLFVTETYKDIRLVGAPPSAVGNFGKDTDNWTWPRHTGDFSMFRIYADKNNRPASYSPDNIPYTPKRSLKISLKGVKEGDFTMVFGFPGRTNEYLSSRAVKQIMEVNDPTKIKIRSHVLKILKDFMIRDEAIKIQYAAKYASIENGQKKWKGEVLGLKKSEAVNKKINYENIFSERIEKKSEWKNKFGTLLSDLFLAYDSIEPYSRARDYFNEIIPRIEIFSITGELSGLATAFEKGTSEYEMKKIEVLQKIEQIFKEYNKSVDKKLFETLIGLYANQQEERFISTFLTDKLSSYKSDISKLSEEVYNESIFSSPEKIQTLLKESPQTTIDKIKSDIAFLLHDDIIKTYKSAVSPKINEYQPTINRLQRNYMQAQLEVFPEKRFYPDANGTMRVTYGNVKGYAPRDAVKFDFYTYSDGILDKYKPGDYEFDLPQELINLYKSKDFGKYGVKGKLPVCFIASNHTTGGNSGSPALDAYGNLIGLNFDRVWEGTMSDLNYDSTICRNIMVDVRYILFIVDKYAKAKNLINEINILN